MRAAAPFPLPPEPKRVPPLRVHSLPKLRSEDAIERHRRRMGKRGTR